MLSSVILCGLNFKFTIERLHLDGVDDADACNSLGVVGAQQQGERDEAVLVQAQLALHVLRPVLLHILAVLKYVPAQNRLLEG